MAMQGSLRQENDENAYMNYEACGQGVSAEGSTAQQDTLLGMAGWIRAHRSKRIMNLKVLIFASDSQVGGKQSLIHFVALQICILI